MVKDLHFNSKHFPINYHMYKPIHTVYDPVIKVEIWEGSPFPSTFIFCHPKEYSFNFLVYKYHFMKLHESCAKNKFICTLISPSGDRFQFTTLLLFSLEQWSLDQNGPHYMLHVNHTEGQFNYLYLSQIFCETACSICIRATSKFTVVWVREKICGKWIGRTGSFMTAHLYTPFLWCTPRCLVILAGELIQPTTHRFSFPI